MAARTFGTLQWVCVRPGSQWDFEGGWGKFTLDRYNSRGQIAGWYLHGPGELDDWVGEKLTEAALAAESLVLAVRADKQ